MKLKVVCTAELLASPPIFLFLFSKLNMRTSWQNPVLPKLYFFIFCLCLVDMWTFSKILHSSDSWAFCFPDLYSLPHFSQQVPSGSPETVLNFCLLRMITPVVLISVIFNINRAVFEARQRPVIRKNDMSLASSSTEINVKMKLLYTLLWTGWKNKSLQCEYLHKMCRRWYHLIQLRK